MILENETKVGGGRHKGAQNGAVKRSLFDASEGGGERRLATRPFVYKLIDITKFKCARSN